MRMGSLGAVLVMLASASAAFGQPNPPNRATNGVCCDQVACEPGMQNAFNGPPCPDPCGLNAFNGEPCCNNYCVWANAEFLYYFLKSGPVPPLVTTINPNIDPAPPGILNNVGILGRPTTAIAYGQQPIGIKDVLGGKVEGGVWLNPGHNFGVEGSWFGLEEVRNTFNVRSDLTGSPVLSRPYIDVRNPPNPPRDRGETILTVSLPNQFTGAVGSNYTTRFYGAEALFVWSPCLEYFKLGEFLFGFRYLDLGENLTVTQTTSLLPAGAAFFNGAAVTAPGVFALADQFATHNQFYGGTIGFRGSYDCNIAYFKIATKLGVGTTRENASVFGSTSYATGAAGSLTTVPGGLLALRSNSGKYQDSIFSLVPEVQALFGVHVTKYMNVHVGYNFLYWSRVARPGDQVDRGINPANLPTSVQFGAAGGPARPAFSFNQSDFWAQGISAGIGFEF